MKKQDNASNNSFIAKANEFRSKQAEKIRYSAQIMSDFATACEVLQWLRENGDLRHGAGAITGLAWDFVKQSARNDASRKRIQNFIDTDWITP